MEQLAKSGIGGILDYAAEEDVESGGFCAALLSCPSSMQPGHLGELVGQRAVLPQQDHAHLQARSSGAAELLVQGSAGTCSSSRAEAAETGHTERLSGYGLQTTAPAAAARRPAASWHARMTMQQRSTATVRSPPRMMAVAVRCSALAVWRLY